MQMPVVTRLSAMCVAGAALTASANASATHYYALHVAEVGGSAAHADDGAFTAIWTNILKSTCNIFQHDFVSHEFWYASDNGGYWVEAGFTDGTDFYGGCHTQTFFWADNRNGGGYHEHFSVDHWMTFGDWETLQISTAGSCAWTVLWDGNNVATSTSNCLGSGRLLTAGIESTSQTTGQVKGWLGNWWEADGSGTWRQQWDLDYLCQDTGNVSNCTGGNPYIEWASGIGTEEVLNESF